MLTYDIVIKEGLIVDGSGRPGFKADLAVKGGRIAKIDEVIDVEADRIINAEGLAVCPGFIDIHTHSDFVLLVNPKAESKVRQGVTTEVVGNCGGSAAPARGAALERAKRIMSGYGIDGVEWTSFSDYLNLLERKGIAINVVALVGHGTVRQCALGMENRPPTERELQEMKSLVAEAMEAGAFGMSSGLVYPPGRYASIEELIELCKVVASYGGIYASHIRGERETIVEAVKEAIEIGRRSGVSVQISHHPAKIGGWGKSKETLRLIEEAREEGIDVNCDMHPYIAGSTGLSALLPPWVQEGGPEKIVQRLKNEELRKKIRQDMIEEKIPGPGPCGLVKRGMWDKLMLADCEKNKGLIGLNFEEIARRRGKDPFEAYFDLLVEEEARGMVVGFYYNEEDIRRVLLHPTSMIGSDGYALAPYGPLGKGKMHPRSYGTFPMVFRKYVRGESRKELIYDDGAKLLTLEKAVMKMTSVTAKKLGLKDRGLLKEGMRADIVILDPKRVADKATYLDPYQYPEGIEYVIVNGELVIDEREHTGSLPGMVLRHK
ncbi:MAG: D-aminoacylase [Thermoproteota archaeon]|nr:MAG: D-aminoacylase [Candidatus Korarchaeota archaeon]